MQVVFVKLNKKQALQSDPNSDKDLYINKREVMNIKSSGGAFFQKSSKKRDE